MLNVGNTLIKEVHADSGAPGGGGGGGGEAMRHLPPILLLPPLTPKQFKIMAPPLKV